MSKSMQIEPVDYNKEVVLVDYEGNPRSPTQTELDTTSIFNQIDIITNELSTDKEFLKNALQPRRIS